MDTIAGFTQKLIRIKIFLSDKVFHILSFTIEISFPFFDLKQ